MDSTQRIQKLLQPESVGVAWLRDNLTMGRCSVLEWASTQPAGDETVRSVLKDLLGSSFHLKTQLQETVTSSNGKEFKPVDCHQQYQARLRLIYAFVQNDADLKAALHHFVQVFDEAWDHHSTAVSRVLSAEIAGTPTNPETPPREPSFMKVIQPSAICDVLRELASLKFQEPVSEGQPPLLVYGWTHPGLLMAGEILAALSGDTRQAETEARTKIMLAFSDEHHPQGLLAEITVERLENGCGTLLPDAFTCGYLQLSRTFSSGLQHALWAARNYAANYLTGSGHEGHDWRWSIDLRTPSRQLKPPYCNWIQLPMYGRSAEVAFACALVATHKDNPDNRGGYDPLDPHVAATASIGSFTAGTDELTGVLDVDVKTLLGKAERRGVVEIVIADNQDMSSVRTSKEDTRFHYRKAASLAEAYQVMNWNQRITRGVNTGIAQRTEELLNQYCTPYVAPAICEIFPESALGKEKDTDETADPSDSGERGDRKQKPRDLEAWEYDALHSGQLLPSTSENTAGNIWIGNRVRLFADSGLGKSIFILQCAGAVAASQSDMLPIRLGRTTGLDAALDDIDWKAGDDIVLHALADRLQWAIDHHVETQKQQLDSRNTPLRKAIELTQEQVRDWLKWMVSHGKVLFLLDALDQTQSVKGLGTFLGGGDRRKCPVIMTGRPEVLRGRSDAFAENESWRTLDLQPFNNEQQKEYLGEELAAELITDVEEVDWQTKDEDKRKLQWKDLLNTPLLLHMLKEVSLGVHKAGRKLGDIKSRYQLYQLAVDHLIEKGWQSIEEKQQEAYLKSKEKLRELLGRVAWAMVRRHDPSNFIEGDPYTELRADFELDAGVLEALQQVDLITAFQVLDKADESGLAFRHRSFLEFFAGCHLMGTVTEKDKDTGDKVTRSRIPDANRKKILRQIHETIDTEGNWLPHMLQDGPANRPAIWYDTLRFALSHAEPPRRDQLAMELIEVGNPWVVYQSMARDHEQFSKPIDYLARWLVHRDYPDWYDYSNAVSEAQADEDTVKANAAVAAAKLDLKGATAESTRDAACLFPLRELLPQQTHFYTEISQNARLLDRLSRLKCGNTTWDFRKTFVPIKGGEFDLSPYEDHKDIQPQVRQIGDFAIGDFPVTNELFELFSPAHRRHRDERSNVDDQPVVHVSWFMAVEFCRWLSQLTGETYRLPNEWEWEYAVRDRNRLQAEYWWGEEMRDELCWFDGLRTEPRTRSRAEAIAAFNAVKPEKRHPTWESVLSPGILDALGNVREWCENPFNESDDPAAPGSSRVLRGGSWYNYADNCRSAYRNNFTPFNRYFSTGFRVCREL